MYPMSFDEFLMANREDALIALKKEASPENPLNPAFHEKLKEYLRYFLLIGGMPEAVKTFIGNRTDMKSVQNVLSDITTSYYDDFTKYKRRIPVLRLRLGSEVNFKKFKCSLHDSGIFQQIAGLRISDLIIAKNIDMLNKGNIAEVFAGVELIKYSQANEKQQLYYWHREKRGS